MLFESILGIQLENKTFPDIKVYVNPCIDI